MFRFLKHRAIYNRLLGVSSRSYGRYVWQQFQRNRRAYLAFYLVCLLAFVAIFADFLANEMPLICSYKGVVHVPILRQYAIDLGVQTRHPDLLLPDWAHLAYDWVIRAPVPYSVTNQHATDGASAPFSFSLDGHSWSARHWLGTDDLGRDVFAAMIHGTRVAFLVGFVSMFIASILGILLGAMAGFWGDDGFKVARIHIFTMPFIVFIAYFYGFFNRTYALSDALAINFINFLGSFLVSVFIFVGILVAGHRLFRPTARGRGFWAVEKPVAIDLMITRGIEVLVSIPTLIIILAVLAITKPSIYNVMVIIGLMSWPNIARFVRAELLRIRRLEYIEAANALGYSDFRVLFRHALPNALSPVFIVVAFGIADAILLESFLSFLGIGSVEMSWGKLLDLARDERSNWWLALFPGFAIFCTITLFNLIGEGLADALDPRLKD